MRVLSLAAMGALSAGVSCRILSLEHGFEVSPSRHPAAYADTPPPAHGVAEEWFLLRDQVQEFGAPWAAGGIAMEPAWKGEGPA